MKIDLDFAELHAPLFLAGTNLQMKLDPSKRRGLTLVYDRGEKELLVTWAGRQAIVPLSNVASMTPSDEVTIKMVTPEQLIKASAKAKPAAQVSTPQSHVHAGPGHGSTGQEPPKGKVVL